MDNRSARPKLQDDLDSIPVVRLDDLPPLPVTPGEFVIHLMRLYCANAATSGKLAFAKSAQHTEDIVAAVVHHRQDWRNA